MFRYNRTRNYLAIALILIAAFTVAGAFSPPATASTRDGVVEFLVFSSPSCGTCRFLDDEVLPRIEEKYGSRIEYRYVDVSEDIEMFRAMLDLEAAYGRKRMEIPQVYIGGDALIGEDETGERIEEVIEKYVALGGTDMPQIPSGDGEPGPAARSDRPVYVTYFYSEGCRDCDAVHMELRYLEKYNPNVKMREYDLSTERGLEMNEALSTMGQVPESERVVAPSVFVGNEYLAGDKLTAENLETAVERVSVTGNDEVWEQAETLAEQARAGIENRFKGFTVLPVLGAGLLDGINPCAFTVIVFFISYLAFVGRRGKEVLYIGIAFAAAILVTYFLIGLGLLSFVRYLGAAGRWVTLGVAILTVLFGLVSLYDYLRGRKKGEAQSTLGLPPNVTRRIHQAIREKTKTRHFIAAAAVLGVVVASLELGCTGQIYLPTITFVARAGGERAKAVFYLAAYNLMFIVPLLVVFAVAYAGTGSEKLVVLGRKHAGGLKLMMAIVFFALAALLFATL